VRDRERLTSVVRCVVGALLLGAAALAYRRVFIFHDAGTYYLYGQHIVSEIRAVATYDRAAIIPLGEAAQDYAGARSPSYSLAFFVLTRTLTLWGAMAAQALAASWLILTLTRAIAPGRQRVGYWVVVAGLTLGSSVSYFVSYSMPDVFGGLGVLALVGLLVFPDRLGRGARWCLTLLLAAAASFHPTFPPVLIASAVTWLGATAVLGAASRPAAGRLAPFLAACVAIAAGGLSGPLYREVERRVFQHPIAAPPFLMARLLEDGPAVDYLREACAVATPFALCGVALHPPIDSDSFLWNEDAKGAYQVVTPTTRQALREEELRFALGTLRSRPGEQLAMSLRNWRRQLLQHQVFEPLFDPKTQASYRLFEMTGSRPGVARSYAWEPVLHTVRTGVLVAAMAALAGLFVMAGRSGAEAREGRRIQVVIAVVVVAVLVNAAICGMVSKPWPRYAARIVWLIPAAALMLAFHPVISEPLTRAWRRWRGNRRAPGGESPRVREGLPAS
jgi:hypothetical protein